MNQRVVISFGSRKALKIVKNFAKQLGIALEQLEKHSSSFN